LSLVPMFGLLASLILIYLRLDIGRAQASREQRIYYHLPFSVYLGWITVAPIANIVAFLVSSGWESYGTTAAYWTVAVIAVAVALTLVNLHTRGDAAYSREAQHVTYLQDPDIRCFFHVYPSGTSLDKAFGGVKHEISV